MIFMLTQLSNEFTSNLMCLDLSFHVFLYKVNITLYLFILDIRLCVVKMYV